MLLQGPLFWGMKLLGKESVIQSNSFAAQLRKKFLNTASDEADVTSLGRPIHNFASATGKARSPTTNRRQVETPYLLSVSWFQYAEGLTSNVHIWHDARCERAATVFAF